MSKKKKFLIIALCTALVLLIAGALLVRHFLYDSISDAEKKEIQGGIDEITNEILAEIKDGTIADASEFKDDTSTDGKNSEEADTVDTDDGSSKSEEQSGDAANTEAQRVYRNYYSGMLALQSKGNGIVDSLMASAKSDYKALKASGGSKKDIASLASSYSSRAAAMESGMDSSVATLVASMEKDLAAAGMSQKAIKEKTKYFYSEYESKKEARRQAIMSMVGSAF